MKPVYTLLEEKAATYETKEFKNEALQEFSGQRAGKRDDKVKEFLESSLLKRIRVDVRTNEPSFFKIPFRNIFEHQEIFEFTVEGLEGPLSDEVQLVKRPKDLELWTELFHYEKEDFERY